MTATTTLTDEPITALLDAFQAALAQLGMSKSELELRMEETTWPEVCALMAIEGYDCADLLAAFWSVAARKRSRAQEQMDDWRTQDVRRQHWKAVCEAMIILGNSGDGRAIVPLFTITKKDGDADLWSVSSALARCGPTDVPTLLDFYVTGSPPRQRECAALALGASKDPRAFDPLLSGLGHRLPMIRSACAIALGNLGDRRAVEPLIAALADHNLSVRADVARALAMLGDERAIEPLAALLTTPTRTTDEQIRTREAAAKALARFGERSVPVLLAALADRRQFVTRFLAADALGTCGDRRAIPPLLATLGDGSARVRGAAAGALRRLGYTDDVRG